MGEIRTQVKVTFNITVPYPDNEPEAWSGNGPSWYEACCESIICKARDAVKGLLETVRGQTVRGRKFHNNEELIITDAYVTETSIIEEM